MDYHGLKNSKESLFLLMEAYNEEKRVWSNSICSVLAKKSLRKFNDNELVRKIFPRTVQELEKMRRDRTYYEANFVCFLSVMDRLITPQRLEKIRSVKNDELRGFLVFNLGSLLEANIFEMEHLVQELQCLLNSLHQRTHFMTPIQQTECMFQQTRQVLFGDFSFDSFIDREPMMAVHSIRQLIEIRLKRAFGIAMVYNPDDGTYPVSKFSDLLSIILRYADRFTCCVPMQDVARIYKWANIFVHTSLKDYTWKLVFLESYLKSFALGHPPDRKGYDSSSGIKLSQSIYDVVRSEYQKKIGKWVIIDCEPQAVIDSST